MYDKATRAERCIERAGWCAVSLLVVVGIVSALSLYVPGSVLPAWLTHLLARLYGPEYQREQLPRFAQYPWHTGFHAIPGILFLLVGLCQFVRRIRTSWMRLHRWLGRLYLLCGVLLALAALAIVLKFPFAGWQEVVPTVVFASLFLWSLAKAYYHVRVGEIAQHREWMIRSFTIGVGIGAIRIIFDLLMASTTRSAQANVVLSFWLGWCLHLVIAEAWIRWTRSASRVTVSRLWLETVTVQRNRSQVS